MAEDEGDQDTYKDMCQLYQQLELIWNLCEILYIENLPGKNNKREMCLSSMKAMNANELFMLMKELVKLLGSTSKGREQNTDCCLNWMLNSKINKHFMRFRDENSSEKDTSVL